MNADESNSSSPRAQKTGKLIALVKRKNSGESPTPQEHDNTHIKNTEKESMKPKKRNAHFYKKLFRKANVAKDTLAKESCSHKKQRLCSEQGCGENVHQSDTIDKIEFGNIELVDFQFEVSTETQDHVLPYVNMLHDHRKRGQNAVFFDSQDRVVKVVSFVSSLLDNTKNPILIIASSSALSLWEIEFSRWSKPVNVVTYKGNTDVRAAIRGSEFQVLLSSPDAIVEDMKMLDHIKWELLVIDECQRPIISMHFKKIQMLMADMKLLTVTGKLVDICASYQNILSVLDPEYKKMHTDAEMEMKDDISTLKERLLPFIAFECTFSTPNLEEYWVPVHLSSMQIEQYCSILASNLEALSSLPRKSSLNYIITQIQKCCDHPYLADPTLRNSSKEASLIDDPLAAEINVSGKLQALDKLLLEIKRCGLRALVLFQSTVNSEKVSTGHILDDLVHQRFGENSYVYIAGKKKESLEMFNNAESECFVCLCDYHACHSSVRLSRVDVVIIFSSDRNPSNDIKALKKITIDSPQLNVLRLYSAFTVEEKTLILSKQGTPVDSYISSSVCHQLLAWGAPYLFSKLQSCTDSGPHPFIDDLVHELSSLLTNTSVKTDRSVISNAHMKNGAYSGSILLFGETETHTKESSSVVEYLIANSPSDFWSNLVKQSQPALEKSGRVVKRTRKRFEGGNRNDATTPSFVRSKRRSKRKLLKNVRRKWAGCPNRCDSIALNPRTSDGQTDQPPPHTLEAEIKRLQKEREQIAKSHQEKKSMLHAECEKEISEVRKKYDGLIHDSETRLSNETKIRVEYEKLVKANKLLAEILAQNWQDSLNLNRTELNRERTQKETSAVKILEISASALVRPCLTRGSTAYLRGQSLAGSGPRVLAPHLRPNSSLSASLHNRPNTGEPSLEPLPTLANNPSS